MFKRGVRFPLRMLSQKLASSVRHLYLMLFSTEYYRIDCSIWGVFSPHMLTAQTWSARMRHCGFIGQQTRAASNGAILSDDGESCWRGEPWFTGSSGSVMRSNSALTPPSSPLRTSPPTHPLLMSGVRETAGRSVLLHYVFCRKGEPDTCLINHRIQHVSSLIAY